MTRELVLQTDFGLVDRAVSAMNGVIKQVDQSLEVSNLTHEIPPFDIWTASYRLFQTVKYWPQGTVFVSVVDPGVGSARRSVVVETSGGQFVVTPDNGSLTHLQATVGITKAWQIDEAHNRLPGSEESQTFHGRDIFAYNGARLAAGQVQGADLGPEIDPASLIKLPLVPAKIEGDRLTGTIEIADVRFGSLWTNIPQELVAEFGLDFGHQVRVQITQAGRLVHELTVPYVRSFAAVEEGSPLAYLNSVYCFGLALNKGSFASQYHIGTGNDWQVSVQLAD